MTAGAEADVHLALDADRALVLSALLWRWENGPGSSPADACFESPAEVRVLIDLLRDLDADLVAPFRDDYRARVEAARARLSDGFEDMALRLES